MKTFLIASITSVYLLAANVTHAGDVPKGQVTIAIDGIQQQQGQAIFVLMNSASSHRGEAPVYAKKIRPVINLSPSAEFELPVGEYSAVVYQDINANGRLDTYFYGKPKEPYGFSNNARNSFGIPRFAEARFVVAPEPASLTITVK